MDNIAREAVRALASGDADYASHAARLARTDEHAAALAMRDGFRATAEALEHGIGEMCPGCNGQGSFWCYCQDSDWRHSHTCEHDTAWMTTRDDTRARADTARREVEQWERALTPVTGDRVIYSNSRARAKFAPRRDRQAGGVTVTTPHETDGTRVPAGTAGQVFWHSDEVQRAPYRNGYMKDRQYRKCGIRLDDGRTFFTDASNLTVVNPWTKFQAQEAVASRPIPVKGDKVTLGGVTGRIFWISDGRCGVKACSCYNRCEHPVTWGRLADCQATE